MSKKQGYFCLSLTFALWGSLYVVSKFMLGRTPAFTISFFRFALAYAALSLMCWRKKITLQKKDYKYVFLIGFGGYFLAVGAQLLGTKYAGASVASLLNSMNPITMTFFAAIILREKLNWKKIGGILLALIGVFIIMADGSVDVSISGVQFSVFSVLLWSLVAVYTRKVTQKYESLPITRIATGIAAICYSPLCLAEIVNAPVQFNSASLLGLLYIGVICTGAAYFLWNKCLGIIEAGTCSAFYPIQPLIAAIFGGIFLKEVIGVHFFIGAFFIITGVLLNLLGGKDADPDIVPE